jgi:hypothetical protein
MNEPKCAECKPKPCIRGVTDESILPSFCPIKNFKDLLEEVRERYRAEDIKDFYLQAALIESSPKKSAPRRSASPSARA